jgi:hypothetical protein
MKKALVEMTLGWGTSQTWVFVTKIMNEFVVGFYVL